MSLAEIQRSIDELMADRDAEMRNLRSQGWSYAKIGRELGISAQAVWQRLSR